MSRRVLTVALTAVMAITTKVHGLIVPRKPGLTLRPLYGEWLVVYSNHPCFVGINNRVVTLFPKMRISLRSFDCVGPFLVHTEKRGSFMVNCTDDGCSLEAGDPEISVCKIDIRWEEETKRFETFLGISINELPSASFSKKRGKDRPSTCLYLHLLEKNQLYLSQGTTFVNLVRNDRPQEPEKGTPLSVFIASQVFGSILLHILHQYFHDLL